MNQFRREEDEQEREDDNVDSGVNTEEEEGRHTEVFIADDSLDEDIHLKEFKEMKVDKQHVDLIVLEYLVKEGHLSVVETFLKEGTFKFSPQEVADWKKKEEAYLLEERSSIMDAIYDGDISRAILLIRRIDDVFFEKRPELLVQFHLQQLIELIRSPEASKVETMLFAKSHLSQSLHNFFIPTHHTRNNINRNIRSTFNDSNSMFKDEISESKDCFVHDTQSFVEIAMMLMAFPKNEVNHTISLAAASSPADYTKRYSQPMGSRCKQDDMDRFSIHLQEILDVSCRERLADQLNKEILRSLGVKDVSSSIVNMLNDMICLQDEILKGYIISKSQTLSSPHNLVLSTFTGLT